MLLHKEGALEIIFSHILNSLQGFLNAPKTPGAAAQ